MRRTPILYIGVPGIGKTQKVKSQYDYTEVLLVSSMTEEDIAGIPYHVDGIEKRTVVPFVVRLQEACKTNNKVCLFLDELDKARREVADTLLTLITNPELFGIPDTVDIVSACNPPERGGGDGISQPMLSRFAVVDFVPNVIERCGRARTKYSDDISLNIIQGFEDGKVNLLEHIGEGYNMRITCPRTIDMSLNAMIMGDSHLVSGLVTSNTASFMLSFLDNGNQKEIEIQRKARNIGAKVKNILRI